MAVQDILLDNNADLDITNGDFKVGDSDAQHIELIVNLAEGSLKQYPTQGVGINQYSGSSGQGATVRRSMIVKAQADGYQNVEVILNQNPDGVFEYFITADRT